MLRPAETMPLDALEASLLLDFYIRLRIAYKPLNRSWCLSLRSQLSGIVLREHSLTNVELGTWGKPIDRCRRWCAATPIILIQAAGAVRPICWKNLDAQFCNRRALPYRSRLFLPGRLCFFEAPGRHRPMSRVSEYGRH